MKILSHPIEPTWTRVIQCPHCLASLEVELQDLTSLEQSGDDIRTGERFFTAHVPCGNCRQDIEFSLPDDPGTPYLVQYHKRYYKKKK